MDAIAARRLLGGINSPEHSVAVHDGRCIRTAIRGDRHRATLFMVLSASHSRNGENNSYRLRGDRRSFSLDESFF